VTSVAIVCAALAPVALSAQARSTEPDSLLARVRQLDAAMLAQSRTVDSTRARLVRSAPPADVTVGVLHVRTEPALEAKVRVATAAVERLIERRGGTILPTHIATHVPAITRDSTRSMFGMIPVIAIDADTASRWSMLGQRHVRAPASVRDLGDGLAATVEQIAMQGVDSSLAAWVMLGRVPIRTATEAEGADTYTELVTTESIALRRCRARDLSACLDALGVDSTQGSRLERWYAPEDYRSAVRTVAPPRDDSVGVAAWLLCRRASDDTACGLAARALPQSQVPLPLSASARFTFFREVLDAGGPGAFDRLVNTPGSLRVRLAAAADEPLERTTARWLARVEQSRADRMQVSPGLVLASLGWAGGILALALTRRSI
jgi:hypothetical protein